MPAWGRRWLTCSFCTCVQTYSVLSNVNKDDGSDALVNAILVARGDALPTQFAGEGGGCWRPPAGLLDLLQGAGAFIPPAHVAEICPRVCSLAPPH